MKRVYRYRSSDKVILGFFETTDSYALRANEFESKSVGKEIIEDRAGRFLYDPSTKAVSSRPQADIDAENAAFAKARIREATQFRSPDGTIWSVKVDDSGILAATKV